MAIMDAYPPSPLPVCRHGFPFRNEVFELRGVRKDIALGKFRALINQGDIGFLADAREFEDKFEDIGDQEVLPVPLRRQCG